MAAKKTGKSATRTKKAPAKKTPAKKAAAAKTAAVKKSAKATAKKKSPASKAPTKATPTKPAKKKAAPARKAAAKPVPAAPEPVSAPPEKQKKPGTVSSTEVNLGHVFALRPRVSTAFRQEHFLAARRLLDDQEYASLEEAARAVAERALSSSNDPKDKRGARRRR